VGLANLPPMGLGTTPHGKPRGPPRSLEDIEYNHAFARRLVVVEHSIGLRCHMALRQMDRHHRCHRAARVVAVASLVNR
jgi:hypothetical protein